MKTIQLHSALIGLVFGAYCTHYYLHHIPRKAPQTPPVAITAPAKQITLDDLLDAIEQVESGGDANAVGDIIIRDDFPGWAHGVIKDIYDIMEDPNRLYPIKSDGWICVEGYNPIKLLDDPNPSDGVSRVGIGCAVGSFQIHKIYVDDVNRICKQYGYYQPAGHYTYEDRWDADISRFMVKLYILKSGCLGFNCKSTCQIDIYNNF